MCNYTLVITQCNSILINILLIYLLHSNYIVVNGSYNVITSHLHVPTCCNYIVARHVIATSLQLIKGITCVIACIYNALTTNCTAIIMLLHWNGQLKME